MADFGIQGTLGTWAEPRPAEAFAAILDDLPPVFTTIWVSDHLQQYGEAWPEGWTRLTFLAGALPRFRFGHLVLSQSYRNPALLASMAATLQTASGGRFILGLGAGWLEEEYVAYDYPYPSGGTRVAQLGETIELVRAMWSGEPTTYAGEHYRVTNAVCPRPEPAIPIMVGTNGPKALKVVARLADWWNWDGPWEVSYQRPYEQLRAACEEIGRPFEEITLTASLEISMPDDPSTFAPTFTHVAYPGQTFGRLGPTAREVIGEIEILVDRGVSHFQLSFESPAGLRRFVDEVVPHVRLERGDASLPAA